jgi:hypothetical protein
MGVLTAKFDLVLFCDDDNWLAPDYILRAENLMRQNPTIGVLGGSSTPVFEFGIEPPDWFWAKQRSYAVGKQATKSSDISLIRGFIWGAGMVIRAGWLRYLFCNGFEPLLSDRRGEILTSGGDNEICRVYLIADYILWYDENLRFQHFIPATRLSLEYLSNILKGFQLSSELLNAYASWINFRNICRQSPTEWIKHPINLARITLLYFLRGRKLSRRCSQLAGCAMAYKKIRSE